MRKVNSLVLFNKRLYKVLRVSTTKGNCFYCSAKESIIKPFGRKHIPLCSYSNLAGHCNRTFRADHNQVNFIRIRRRLCLSQER